MPDIHFRLTMSAPQDEVFAAMTTGVLSRASEIGVRASVLTYDRNARAVWRCVDGPTDWIGTEIAIDVGSEDGDIIVSFAHRHWPEATDAMASCTTLWGRLLLGLQRVVEIPEPDDTRL